MAKRSVNQPTLYSMYRKVKDIQESSSTNWPICVWITEKSGINVLMNRVKYLKLVLEDDSGKIQAMVYDDVEERDVLFKNGGTRQKYVIRGADVEKSNKQSDTFGHNYELIITKNTTVTPCTIVNNPPYHRTQISRPNLNQENNNCQREIKPRRRLKMSNQNAAETLSNNHKALSSEDEFQDPKEGNSPSPPKKQRLSRSARSANRTPKKIRDDESESGNSDADTNDKAYSPTPLKPLSTTPKRVLRSRSRVDYEELPDNLIKSINENYTKMFDDSKDEQETISKYGKIRKRSSTRLRSTLSQDKSLQENQDPFEVKQRGKRKSLSRRAKNTKTKYSEEIIIVTDESSDDDFAQPQHQKITPNMKGKGALEDSDDSEIVYNTISKRSGHKLSEQSDDDFVEFKHHKQTPRKIEEDLEDSDGSEVAPKYRKTPLKALDDIDESSGAENSQLLEDDSIPEIESYETNYTDQNSDDTILNCQSSDEESTQTTINDGLPSYSSSLNPSYEDSGDDIDNESDDRSDDDDDDESDSEKWPDYYVESDVQSEDSSVDVGKVRCLVFTMVMKAFGDPAVAEEDEMTRELTRTLMNKINTKRDECVTQAWFPECREILESRPIFRTYEECSRSSFTYLKDCEVCNISNRPWKFRVTLSGTPYNPKTLEPKDDDDEEQDEMEYVVGKFCYVRVKVYHDLYHLPYKLYNDCKRRLEECPDPDKLATNKFFIKKYCKKINTLLNKLDLHKYKDEEW